MQACLEYCTGHIYTKNFFVVYLKFKYHIVYTHTKKLFVVYLKFKYCMGYTYDQNLFVVFLKFKFNGVSCILSGNTISKVLLLSQWPTPPLAQVGVAP